MSRYYIDCNYPLKLSMKKIAKYEIVEELGKGGMGIVYKAFDPLMEREVAIKVLAEELFDQPKIKRTILPRSTLGR